VLSRALEPFFTTKKMGHGTGLGLSMVYGFVKQSGGHVRIDSMLGSGTSVRLYLPRAVADVQAETVSVPQEVTDFSGRDLTVLLVEDDAGVRAVTAALLRELQFSVIEADSGARALDIIDREPGVDLLFTDVVMPGGMNGFDLSQAAQQLRPDLKIIHTSGYPKGAMEHQEEPRLKDNLIMKPYRREELERVVRETLEGAAA
jgi:CheY-like chemotaxis protein